MKTYNRIILSVMALCVLCVGCVFVFSDTPSNVASAEELPIFTFKYNDVTYDALRTTKFDNWYISEAYSSVPIPGSSTRQYALFSPDDFTPYNLLNLYLSETAHIYLSSFTTPQNSAPLEITDIVVNSATIALLTFTDDAYSKGFDAGRKDYELNTLPGLISSAKQQGYDSGYSAGVVSGSDYTFFSLMSAVVDAPLNVFKDMFNFEILGVDISSFLLSLFTLCLVVTVTKFLLAR